MNIKNFKQKDRDSVQFTWENPKQHLIHGIQRVMISEIPTLAIDMVMIDENSSIMADQELSLRLGLIPMLSENANEFLLPDECECENFCSKCSIRLSLNVSCYEGVYHVTSKDFVCHDDRSRPVHESTLPNEFLGEDGFGPGVFIVTLIKNQRIRLSCIVRKGSGKIHGKWNPTSRVSFIPIPKVKVNLKRYNRMNDIMEEKLRHDLEHQIRLKYTEKCTKNIENSLRKEIEQQSLSDQNNLNDEEYFKELLAERVELMMQTILDEHLTNLVDKNKLDWKKQWVDSCPRGVFKGIDDIEDYGEKWWTPTNNNECIVCDACILEAEDRLEIDNLITVSHHTSQFDCNIDGTGVLSPKRIMNNAIDILQDKFNELLKEIESL